ncbi:lytic transglycosylase domain-containing protein [Spirosoma utsteinense]|uniref:Transglycosylase SLT domain-containing protein n=1 Tax=Spirosoma utsteinense TaxID=2585773 RepID=A0ABR6W9F7_9BACT|nr:lytic transglycosylase domain-containing protein [Spirosoma utsteinense]MBC3787607.1 hypothetical protein [Spirosoma utsteinense]MBC3793203.1 hypothetical protein [Spirosoma utsteinense]
MTKLILLLAAELGRITFAGAVVATPNYSAAALNARPNGLRPLAAHALEKTIDPVHFCGEILPVDSPVISARWLRTLSRQAAMAGSLIALKRRALAVFPLIEPILNQYQIPSDFKFLLLLESAVINRAVSRRGAAGFWQLMPQTAHALGLSVSPKHDERFDLRKATHAACRYLNDLHKQLGSWMLVASAYNAGPTYIGQLSRQHPTLHPMALPYRTAETKAYLYQAVAIKELLTHPHAYRNYLSSSHLAALSEGIPDLRSGERTAIMAAFDTDESIVKNTPDGSIADSFEPDSTTAVVLLMDNDTTPDEVPDPDAVTPEPVLSLQPLLAPGPVEVMALQLVTRSLSEGPLTEGKLCLFQVIQAVSINGRNFSVGDLIQAHIEIIDTASGRVYLRTDQHSTGQETTGLNLVATGQPSRPGVELPLRLENWRLTWESL